MTSRGTALIVVNEFPDNPKLLRNGAHNEYEQMCKMFGELGFDLVPCFNLKAAEIENEFKKAIKMPGECFVFVIATHGAETETNRRTDEHVNEQMLLGSDCQPVFINELLKFMDKETIREKIKLCFIQACRNINPNPRHPAFSPVDLGVTVSVSSPILPSQKMNETDTRDTLGSTNRDTADSAVKNTRFDKEVESVLNSEDFNIGDRELKMTTAPSELNRTEQKNEYANTFDLPDPDNEEEAEDESDPGSGDSGMPTLPLPVIPVDCPPNCLIMFSVQQHKTSFRSPKTGSWMLQYMFEKRGELKNNDGNILPFLPQFFRNCLHMIRLKQ